MLFATPADEGLGVYVAIERFDGALHGREGSFVFRHDGIRESGAQSLSVIVVPGSASGELVGLRGDLAIDIDVDGTVLHVRSRLMGRFNARNLLAVTAVLVAFGHPPATFAPVLEAELPHHVYAGYRFAAGERVSVRFRGATLFPDVTAGPELSPADLSLLSASL